MARTEARRDVAISMRLERNDLGLIDRGAELSGLSRTEFMRRAALNEAQTAILNETVLRLSPDAWRQFRAAIEVPTAQPPAKLAERLKRRPAWREAKAGRPPAA
ncbi:MAG: DUF1778 domain-containing protein [Alphaproteobacteria bacterium]|nr:DUF1778 domain-containing protein [Alphaproteobacteria bacterium]